MGDICWIIGYFQPRFEINALPRSFAPALLIGFQLAALSSTFLTAQLRSFHKIISKYYATRKFMILLHLFQEKAAEGTNSRFRCTCLSAPNKTK
jgi:hypothetical protein